MPLENEVGSLVREMEQNWTLGEVQVSKYVSQNFYEDVQKVDAYLNSKFTTGAKDSLKRAKPFLNIVIAARNIWFRATDLDRKNIKAKAGKSKDSLASFIYTVHLQKWMRDTDFGRFLNDWGIYLASFNSAVVKFVENSDGLHPQVIDWNKIICDVIDFEGNPKIEVLEFTPAQLRKQKGYDKDMVEQLIQDQPTTRKLQSGQTRDQKDNYIKLYEVHGELPLSHLTEKEDDETTYVQQMHVISYVIDEKTKKYNDYTLVSGREKKDPFMLTWLLPAVDGSISLMGSVKILFETQWMVNNSIKAIKDSLDVSSKIFFQTADPQFSKQNLLNNIEFGDIKVWDKNIPDGRITQVNNQGHDTGSLQNFSEMWRQMGQEMVSTPDAMLAKTPPSGTAYRQTAIVTQEAHSNFEPMIQNKGLHLEKMFTEFITPHLLKKMDTTEEISATLEAYGIDKIDQAYISTKAVKEFNRKAVEAVLNDTELPDLAQEEQIAQQDLNSMGGQRFLKPSDIKNKTWKEVIGDFEGDVIYEITDENVDKQETLDSLNTMLQVLANPNYQAFFQTEQGKFLLNKTIEEVGRFSPLEMPQNTPVAPVGGAVGAGGQAQLTQQQIQ